jgi:lipoyl synthase
LTVRRKSRDTVAKSPCRVCSPSDERQLECPVSGRPSSSVSLRHLARDVIIYLPAIHGYLARQARRVNRSPVLELPVISATTGSAATGSEAPRLPRWLKREVPKGNANHFTSRVLEELRLETVCENAKCPNRMECYSQKTATFMILGNVCTRPCGFCAVARGRPDSPELDEPERLAEAVVRLGLKHVVITSVTRDDLADGGAEHFYQCVEAVRRRVHAAIEVLTPDFLFNHAAVARVVESRPDVFNHNVETVPRLYREVRGPKSHYSWTMRLLRTVRQLDSRVRTKSGLMLGLGETREELLDVLADLLDSGCELLTLGQYLQPSPKHLPVMRFVPPEEFTELGRIAKRLGFREVASGPFVRSSYHARDMANAILS